MKNRKEKKQQQQQKYLKTNKKKTQKPHNPTTIQARGKHTCLKKCPLWLMLKIEHNLPHAPSHQIPSHYSITENIIISNPYNFLFWDKWHPGSFVLLYDPTRSGDPA